MDTKNLISPGRKHRHFVALPLLAASLLLVILLTAKTGTLWASLMRGDQASSTTLTVDAGSGFTLIGGIAGIADRESDATIVNGEIPELTDGSVLLSSKGIERITVGSGEVMGLAGTIFLSRNDDAITIAGITAPALYTDAQGQRLLVPADMRWEGDVNQPLPTIGDGLASWRIARALSPLSSVFLSQETAIANGLQPSTDVLPSPQSSKPDCNGFSLALLPGARQEAKDRCEVQMFGYLRALSEANDAQGLHDLSSDPSFSGMLRTSLLKTSVLPVLLAGSSEENVQRELLGLLSDDENFWLLASIHPHLRSLEWALSPPSDVSQEASMLRLFTFPSSDVLTDAVSPQLRSLWQSTFTDALSKESVPSMDLEAWKLSQDSVSLMRSLHYPDRTAQYAQAFLSLLSPIADGLDSSLTPLRTLSIGDQADETSQADVLDEAARSLTETGVRFTVDSSISFSSDRSVRFTDVIAGERTFAFTYDIESSQVSGISEGGKFLPYPMPLEKFMKWTKEESQ